MIRTEFVEMVSEKNKELKRIKAAEEYSKEIKRSKLFKESFEYFILALVVIGLLLAAGYCGKLDLETENKPEKEEEPEIKIVYVYPSSHEIGTDDIEMNHQIEQEEAINEEDVYLLSHLINGESGSSWCTDEMRYYVGSVVLNRMNDDRFPNTIKEVIYQDGQYACIWDGNFDKEPSEDCIRIAEELLTNGSVLPEEVVWQAQFKQGKGVYEKVQNMYFCY